MKNKDLQKALMYFGVSVILYVLMNFVLDLTLPLILFFVGTITFLVLTSIVSIKLTKKKNTQVVGILLLVVSLLCLLVLLLSFLYGFFSSLGMQ